MSQFAQNVSEYFFDSFARVISMTPEMSANFVSPNDDAPFFLFYFLHKQ
jgi:hypothetical protein